jgi:3',5'-cyclic AMP phosphodiesterase CpdA
MSVRLAHLSDIHITTPRYAWRLGDWFTKRFTSWLNLRFRGRGKSFQHADRVLEVLMAELRQRRPDRVVFSGDATALGFESEVQRAASLLGLTAPDPLPGLAVPGNHDYLTRRAVANGRFEQYFAPWQVGEVIERHPYPFAQRVGPLWLVAVNSATPNRWITDASGAVGTPELLRLEMLLARLNDGLRILVTHYPVCDGRGGREKRSHQLRNMPDVVAVAERGGVCLWLHGHRHESFHFAKTAFSSFPVICVGSSTQMNYWGYNEYTITGHHLEGVRRVFDPGALHFRDAEQFTLELPER